MDVIKVALMVIGGLAILVVGSCAVTGYVAVKAVESASANGSQVVADISKEARLAEIRRHNDEMNREASYENPRSFDEEY